MSVLVASCGGGGGGAGSSSPGNGLSGSMTVANFLIPAGVTKTVTGDLTIHATQSVEIDGNLIIPPNVNVAIVSDGTFVNNGLIEPPAKPAIQSKGDQPKTDRGGPTNLVFGAGGKSTVELGSINAPANTNLYISGSTFNTLISATQLTTQDGSMGTDSSTPGGNAGRIEIGSSAANALGKNAGLSGVGTPTNILVGSIITGSGGDGFTDTKGVKGANVQIVTGSAGGNGGSIVINATGILTIKSCQAGDGGHGGGASFTAYAYPAVGTKGMSVEANIGAGGNGGSVTSTPALPTAIAGVAGLSGTANGNPNLTIAAHDGGIGGGAGGDCTVIVGTPGTNGVGPNLSTAHGQPTFIIKPGSGQNSLDSGHPGGNGGQVTLKSPGGVPVTMAKVQIYPGQGGTGYGVCLVSGKNSAGTNGGDGSAIAVFGSVYTAGTAANGGNGGDGAPAGTGGKAPTDDAGKLLGKPGSPGKQCGSTGATLYKTASVPGSPAFCSLDPNSGMLFCSAAELSQTMFSYMNLNTYAAGQWQCYGSLPDNQNNLTTSAGTQRGNGVIYTTSLDHTVKMINDVTGAQIGSIQVPNQQNGPSAVAYEASTGRLYVAVDQGVDVFDTTNGNSLVGTITSTVSDASAMAVNENTHRLYLLLPTITFTAGTVSVMNTTSLTEITQIALPDYSGVIALDPTTGNVFVSLYNQGKVVEISGTSNTIVNTVSVGTNPWGIRADSKRGRVYVVNYNYSSSNPLPGSLTELNESDLSTITTVTLGRGPTGVAVDETGDLVYVANSLDNTVSILNGN